MNNFGLYNEYNYEQISMIYKKICEAAKAGKYKIDINSKLDNSTIYFFTALNYYVHPTREGQRFEWHRKKDYAEPLNRKVFNCYDAFIMDDLTR